MAGIVVSSSRDRLPGGLRHRDRDRSQDGDAMLRRAGTTERGGQDADRRRARGARAPAPARATWPASRTPSCASSGPGCPTACGCCRCSSSTASTPDAVRRRWRRAGSPASPAGPVGVTEQGVFSPRPRARRPARARRRHHRLGQERAAAEPDRRAGRERRPAPADVPADGLQGRRGVRRLRRPAAHRRDGHRPRRGARSSARCARWRPSSSTASGCCAAPAPTTCAPTTSATTTSRCRGSWS